jgi:hypothetical protein
MSQLGPSQTVVDKFDTIEVTTVSLCSRGSGDWDSFASCFEPEVPITTS